MTEGVRQAATPNAVHGRTGHHHDRRNDHAADAFSEALATRKTVADRLESGAGTRQTATVHSWRHTEAGPDATIEDTASEHSPRRAAGTGPREAAAKPHVVADEADADADAGLPTQIKAEHAISAIMIIAPIAQATPTPASATNGRTTAIVGAASEASLSQENRQPAGQRSATDSLADALSAQPAAAAAPDAEAGSRDTARAQAATAQVQSAAAPAGRQQPDATPVDREPKRQKSFKTEAAGPPAHQSRPADAAAASNVAAADPQKPRAGAEDGREGTGQRGSERPQAAREARRGDPAPAAARVTVLAGQAIPAAAAPSLGANGQAIVGTIAADPGWRTAAAASAGAPAQEHAAAQPMRSLKIQLHPAELGVVTANLRSVGEQLSVTLQVDSPQAWHRLTLDSEAILKSLRALGFDIDKVSIQQPQAAAATAIRSEHNAAAGAFGRETASFQSGNSGNGGERFGGQASERGQGGEHQGNEAATPAVPNRAGSGLYI